MGSGSADPADADTATGDSSSCPFCFAPHSRVRVSARICIGTRGVLVYPVSPVQRIAYQALQQRVTPLGRFVTLCSER